MILKRMFWWWLLMLMIVATTGGRQTLLSWEPKLPLVQDPDRSEPVAHHHQQKTDSSPECSLLCRHVVTERALSCCILSKSRQGLWGR